MTTWMRFLVCLQIVQGCFVHAMDKQGGTSSQGEVVCEPSVRGGPRLRLNPSRGTIELTQTGESPVLLQFQGCRFSLSGVVSSADRLANYTCENKGVGPLYVLSQENSGEYFLREITRVAGERLLVDGKVSMAKTNANNLVKTYPKFRSCKDPQYEAWAAEMNRSSRTNSKKNGTGGTP